MRASRGRSSARGRAVYLRGLLVADVPRKNVEAVALWLLGAADGADRRQGLAPPHTSGHVERDCRRGHPVLHVPTGCRATRRFRKSRMGLLRVESHSRFPKDARSATPCLPVPTHPTPAVRSSRLITGPHALTRPAARRRRCGSWALLMRPSLHLGRVQQALTQEIEFGPAIHTLF